MKPWRVDDVMTRAVVAVSRETPYRDVVDVLLRHRISAVPVTDGGNAVLGVVSEADLLLKMAAAGLPSSPAAPASPAPGDLRWGRADQDKADGRTAGDVMTSPAVMAGPTLGVAAAARRMREARVKRLPVADEQGRLIGIVTRSDLLKAQLRTDADIRHEIFQELRAIPSGEPGLIRAGVTAGVVRLYGRTNLRSTATTATELAARTRGVVAVIDEITYTVDDAPPG